MRKLASVVRIASCDPIPDTDRLSVTTMEGLGWNVVTSRDEFKAGDLAVYFEIDAFLNADDERYAFLRERCLRKFVSKSGNLLDQGLRIKTVKLRGVISQGLLMPIDKFQEIAERATIAENPYDDTIRIPVEFVDGEEVPNVVVPLIGADVTKLLHVRHHDEIKETLAPVDNHAIGGDAYGLFPTEYIPKTDEQRIQSETKLFETLKDRRFEVSVKADGSSCTIAYSPTIDSVDPNIVCSRNIRLKHESRDGIVPVMWQLAEKYKVIEALRAHCESTGLEWALQGEAVGPGIQSCRNHETEHTYKVFKIWDITNQKYVDPATRRKFCTDNGIPHVDVIAEDMQVFHEFTDVESLLKFAEGKTKEGYEREGLVFKTIDEPAMSFKAVSNRYLLKLG